MRLTDKQDAALEVLVDHRRRYAAPMVRLTAIATSMRTGAHGAARTLASLERRGLVIRGRLEGRVAFRVADDVYAERIRA